jgi:adenylate kinase
MFRALDGSSELGREVRSLMERGELVPDETTIRMIEDRLSQDDAVDGFVLDGFPRNLAQAEALDAMLSAIGRGLDAILFFDLPDAVALERMRGRGNEEGRSDDTPEAMQRRLEIYHQQTVPVVEHYRATGKLVPLHADRSVDEVADEIQRALDLFDDDAA